MACRNAALLRSTFPPLTSDQALVSWDIAAAAAAAAGFRVIPPLRAEVTALDTASLGLVSRGTCADSAANAIAASSSLAAASPSSIGFAPSSIFAIRSNFSAIAKSFLDLISSFSCLTSCPVEVIGPMTSRSCPHCKQNLAVASTAASHVGQCTGMNLVYTLYI